MSSSAASSFPGPVRPPPLAVYFAVLSLPWRVGRRGAHFVRRLRLLQVTRRLGKGPGLVAARSDLLPIPTEVLLVGGCTNSVEGPSGLGTLRIRGGGRCHSAAGVVSSGAVLSISRASSRGGRALLFFACASSVSRCPGAGRAALGGCTTGPVVLLGIVDRPS